MSFLASLAGDLGLGSGLGTNPVTGQTIGQPFSDADKQFIKAQFKYGLLLNQKLASGQITQAYHDANLWLTTETLTPPYNGWLDEFSTAINQEDLNWLAKQVGETVDQLTLYMGDALHAVASAAGNIVATAISGTSSGLISGFFGGLNWGGWLVIGGLGLSVYYGWKKGYIQELIPRAIKLIP